MEETRLSFRWIWVSAFLNLRLRCLDEILNMENLVDIDGDASIRSSPRLLVIRSTT